MAKKHGSEQQRPERRRNRTLNANAAAFLTRSARVLSRMPRLYHLSPESMFLIRSRHGWYTTVDLIPWFVAATRETFVLVPERTRKCVLFIGIKASGIFKPRATAFLIEIQDQQHLWRYLVTAEHVVSGLLTKGHDIWLRVNNKSGPPQELKIAPKDWWYHPETDVPKTDVAVVPILLDNESDVNAVPIWGPKSVAATREVIDDIRIGVGDEVVVTGLFRSHHGQQRNVPITRIGNIAMLNEEPVKTKYCGYVDAYLIEARSIGGLSGSPTFVHLPAIRTIDGKAGLHQEKRIFQLYLLGLMHGHFDIEDLNLDVVIDHEDDSTSGIHAGIGVVIPVEKIIETVMQSELSEMRRKAVDEDRKQGGATPDLAN
jgi:hypothetical protein